MCHNMFIEVKSSNILEVAYSEENLLLRVRFKSGKVYQYHKVPPEAYKQFILAESKGSYFAKFIKGKYNYIQEPEISE